MSCCIIGCPNSGPNPSKETTYHLFPHPEKGLLESHIHGEIRSKKKTSMKIYLYTDSTRFRQWLNMCNDPRLDALEPILVQKRHRICRRHFDSDCMNGGCRRLLNTAIPTLHMNGSPEKDLNLIVEDTTDLENEYILAVKEELTLIPVGIDEIKNEQENHFEIISASKSLPMSVPTVESMYIALNCNQCISSYFMDFHVYFLLFSFWNTTIYKEKIRWRRRRCLR